MNRLNNRLDIAKERIIELGGKSRKLSSWSPEREIMKAILGDTANEMKKSDVSHRSSRRETGENRARRCLKGRCLRTDGKGESLIQNHNKPQN